MNVPKGFKPKGVKDMEDLLEKKREHNEIYIKRVQCPYFQDNGIVGDVFLKIKGTEVIGIKCGKFKKNNYHECFQIGDCYLNGDWDE